MRIESWKNNTFSNAPTKPKHTCRGCPKEDLIILWNGHTTYNLVAILCQTVFHNMGKLHFCSCNFHQILQTSHQLKSFSSDIQTQSHLFFSQHLLNFSKICKVCVQFCLSKAKTSWNSVHFFLLICSRASGELF